MNETDSKLRRIKADAAIGKKKHFNAADRKETLHYWIGIPLVIINLTAGSVLFYAITDGEEGWIKFIPLVLSFVAAVLSGFQTYFNLPKKVEGHRNIGDRYLALMKKCDRLQGYISDSLISKEEIVKQMEEIATEIDGINREAGSFPTNKADYKRAIQGIEAGEETYTDKELSI